MGCGKSEALRVLAAEASTGVVLCKFAQPLYDMQELIYNRISSVYQRPEGFVKDRKLLQWIGTEWGRDTISKTLWGDLWQANVDDVLAGPGNLIAVCDDVRFDNEAERFTNMGGVIIQIRTSRNHERIDTRSGITNHQSEAGIDPRFVGHVIDNDGTLRQYQEKLAGIFRELQVTKER